MYTGLSTWSAPTQAYIGLLNPFIEYFPYVVYIEYQIEKCTGTYIELTIFSLSLNLNLFFKFKREICRLKRKDVRFMEQAWESTAVQNPIITNLQGEFHSLIIMCDSLYGVSKHRKRYIIGTKGLLFVFVIIMGFVVMGLCCTEKHTGTLKNHGKRLMC